MSFDLNFNEESFNYLFLEILEIIFIFGLRILFSCMLLFFRIMLNIRIISLLMLFSYVFYS